MKINRMFPNGKYNRAKVIEINIVLTCFCIQLRKYKGHVCHIISLKNLQFVLFKRK